MRTSKVPILMEKFYVMARFKWDSVCIPLEDLHIDVEIDSGGYVYYIPRDVVDFIQLCDEACVDCAEPQLIYKFSL